MKSHWCPLALLMVMMPSLAFANGFGPFASGAKHPFVGKAAHVPGEGPQFVLPKPLNTPSDVRVQRGGHKAVRLSSNPLYLAALFYRNYCVPASLYRSIEMCVPFDAGERIVD